MVAGDVLVVPQGDEHVMGSDLALKPTPMKVLIPQIPWPGMPPVIHGGGGVRERAEFAATPGLEKAYRDGLSDALKAGHQVLAAGGPAV